MANSNEYMKLYMRRYRKEIREFGRITRGNRVKKTSDPEYNKKACREYYWRNRAAILEKSRLRYLREKEEADRIWGYKDE